MIPSRLSIALACTAALLFAGCSGSDDSTGTPTGGGTTVAPTTTTATTGGEGGMLVNQTGDSYSCTAQPGVVGSGGSNIVTVSGCNLTTLASDATYQKEEIPAGCDVSFDEDGDGQVDGRPEVGATYKGGTSFIFGCGATNAQGQGTIWLLTL